MSDLVLPLKAKYFDAIKEGLDRHEIQLLYTTLPDLKKAVAMVQSNVRAARSGRMTTVTIIEGALA